MLPDTCGRITPGGPSAAPRAGPSPRCRPPENGGSLAVAACGSRELAVSSAVRISGSTLTGAPARLRPLPRLLLRTEVPVSGSAAGAALLACWQQRPGVARWPRHRRGDVAVQAVREAIHLSLGYGSEEPDAQ